MPEVIRTLEIAAPASALWKWFASQEALRQWWGTPDLQIDLVLGGEFSMTGADGHTPIRGRVLELDPERRLVLSWFEEDSDWLHPGRLLFLLEPAGDGTRVTVQHDGFAGLGTPTWPRVQEAYERGSAAHALLPKLATLVLGDAA